MDNPILKRLGALDINDEFAKKELKEKMSELDAVLLKAREKAANIELTIKEGIELREKLLELKNIDMVALGSFNTKLHNLALKKKAIEKAIDSVVAKIEINNNEKEK